ncbi:MAG: ribosome maturation factor RimP [Acidobacteriota bacterium]
MKSVAFLDRMRSLAEEASESCGLELFDLEHRLSGRRWWFRVTIDRLDGPVTIEDCEAVSRALSMRLDLESLIEHAYDLEVSSPGLERPLRHVGDCGRFLGNRARFVLSSGGEGPAGPIEGTLKSVEEETVLVELDNGNLERIPYQRVKKAHLVFEFPK